VVQAIGNRHEVIPVSFSKSAITVDIENKTSITRMFEAIGRVDAVISAAGLAKFGPITSLTDADFALGLDSKLMGQVNLVRVGMDHVNDNGSFTLTSGILSHRPMKGSAAISLVTRPSRALVVPLHWKCRAHPHQHRKSQLGSRYAQGPQDGPIHRNSC